MTGLLCWMLGELNLSSLSDKTQSLNFIVHSFYRSGTYMVAMHWEGKVLVINSVYCRSACLFILVYLDLLC